jgi:hypothetical protein
MPRPLRLGLELLALAAWVALARYASFDLAIADQDESYYLLQGAAWFAGHPPYTQLWDVKPPGLLLIFGVFNWLAPPGVLASRIGSAVAVFLGSVALFRFARHHLSGRGTALVAAFLYPPFTAVLWGASSPPEPFLAPFVIWGMDIAVGWWTGARARGLASCLAAGSLFGAAVLIKQTAVFELALAALAAAWPPSRPGWRPLALFIAAAALPSLAFIAYSIALGVAPLAYLTPFLAALYRLNGDGISFVGGIGRFLPMMKPLLPILLGALLCIPERRRLVREPDFAAVKFIALWAAASAAGIIAMRSMYAHYYLTLVPPLVLATALWLRTIAGGIGRTAVAVLCGVAAIFAIAWAPIFEIPDMRRAALPDNAAAALVELGLKPGDGLFVADQDPMIYLLTGARIPTRYAFSQHLMCAFHLPDGRAQEDEIRRIMEGKPGFVVISHERQWMLCDLPDHLALVDEYLTRDYDLAKTVDGGRESVDIYRLKEAP